MWLGNLKSVALSGILLLMKMYLCLFLAKDFEIVALKLCHKGVAISLYWKYWG